MKKLIEEGKRAARAALEAQQKAAGEGGGEAQAPAAPPAGTENKNQ